MHPMSEWWLKLKIYCTFTKQEIVGIFASIIIFGFMFSFKNWDTVSVGLGNWLLSGVILFFSLFIHEIAHKIAAISVGFKATFKLSWTWIWGTLAACFVTNGFFIAPINGTIELKLAGRQRLGHFRYGLNYWAAGVVSFLGPLSNLIIAIMIKSFMILFPQSIILEKALWINVSLAIFNMLPFPGIDGLQTFYGERMFYFSMLTIVIITGVSLMWLSALQSIVIGLLAATMVFGVIFYYENK